MTWSSAKPDGATGLRAPHFLARPSPMSCGVPTLADRRYCYPLTISEFASRYLIALTVLGGLAEFERELIRSRTSEGRERGKAKGVVMAASRN